MMCTDATTKASFPSRKRPEDFGLTGASFRPLMKSKTRCTCGYRRRGRNHEQGTHHKYGKGKVPHAR